jgi:hypothetical protein
VGETVDPNASYNGLKFSLGEITDYPNSDAPPNLSWLQYTGFLEITPGSRDEYCPYSYFSIVSFDFFLQNSDNEGPVVVDCYDQYGNSYNYQGSVPVGGTTVLLPSSITSIQAVKCQVAGFGNLAGTFYNVIDNIVFQ